MKFKKFYYIIILFIICLFGFITSSYSKIDNLNEIIDVGNILYVQHDENNQDIYLLNSFSLPVYEVLNVKYTASKQWTQDGLYIDDLTGKVSATSPDDYIPVFENETYFVRLYGIGSIYTGESGNEWHITTPIVFFDDNNNCVGSALTSTFSASKNGVEITIPNSATKMYISNYNNQNISIQKKLTLDENEFNIIKNKQKEILNYIDSSYENIQNDPVIYNDYDKAYITFVNDDTRPTIDQFADLFINKNVPLCLATIASNSLNTASNLRETRLEVLKRVEENGGEILAHYENPITNENIDDKNYLYNYFVVQKQLLTSYGLNVNGIILAGGNGQITGNIKTSSWASSIYKYSDLLGEKNNNFTSTYFKPRKALSNFNNDLDKMKKSIDEAIDNNEWHVYYFHDVNEISLENLEVLIDYIQSKENVEIVTYKTMYDKFATRESNVKNNKKIYYVASNGTSNDGTSIDKAINLDTLNKKKIKSGDTILFKRGDNFIGSVALNINTYDNKKITISSYGNGDLPTISLYKYLNKVWEKFDENIYRINIKELDDIKSYNVAYLEDDNKIKYYNKKNTLGSLSNNYDFYSDNLEYLYMYLNEDPYRSLGNLKCVVKGNLFNLYSNMHISNLRFSYSGGHALVSPESRIENVEIDNCIIENIGGSYLYSNSLSDDTRYGNGIEFYNTDVKDVKIKNNIFRNIYDVAFTIQGVKGSGTNIFVDNNVFINNSQDSEIWESENAQGVVNYLFANNLSINQGKGWSYLARSDKYASASILFWGYDRTNTDISFIHNVLYNPRQIYYFALTTDNYFLHHDTIKSDENIYYLNEDATIYRNNWNYYNREEFIEQYQIDENSQFHLIEDNQDITNLANVSNNINEIRLAILKPEDVISSIELNNNVLEIRKGHQIDLNNLKLRINYQDGTYENKNIDLAMLSKIDYNILNQEIEVTYLSFKTSFKLKIIEEETTITTTKKIDSIKNNEEVVITTKKPEIKTTQEITTTTKKQRITTTSKVISKDIKYHKNTLYIIIVLVIIVIFLIYLNVYLLKKNEIKREKV